MISILERQWLSTAPIACQLRFWEEKTVQIGNIKPGYHENSETTIWSCPIEVWMQGPAVKMKVVSVYEDEGVLCIDIEQPGDEA